MKKCKYITFKLSRHVECVVGGFTFPGFCDISGQSPLKEGVKVEVIRMDMSAVTNPDGTFQISDVPKKPDGYTIRISKPGYLTRDIKNVIVESPYINVGSANTPVDLWAGVKFKPNCDINKDGSINLSDIMIVASHFNKNTDSYTNI